MLSFLFILVLALVFYPTPTPEPIEPPIEVVEEIPVEEPTVEPVEEPVTPTPAPAEKPVTPAPQPQPTVTHVTSLPEYEELVKGLCPSQRPHTNFDDYDGLLPALGLKSSGYTDNGIDELKQWIGVFWSSWRVHRSAYPNEVSVGSINQFGLGSIALSFYIYYPTLTVTYHNTWADETDLLDRVRQNRPELISQLDQIASDMTSYLRYLDSAYTAKCPND